MHTSEPEGLGDKAPCNQVHNQLSMVSQHQLRTILSKRG